MKRNQLVDLFGLTSDPRRNEQAERVLLRLESEILDGRPEMAAPPVRVTVRARPARSEARPDFERITDCSYIII